MAIIYSIDGGADASKFNIDATSGALTFKAAPDFEKPGDANADNIYEVSVKATDAGGAASSKLIKVTVTDVSENAPPQITSSGAVSMKENTTTVMTVTATDPDQGTPPVEPPVEPPSGNSEDGSANAPAGTPQAATMLSGYMVRPSWKVAGVDYYVGIPSGTTLKAPASQNGMSVNTSTRTANVTGSNTVIDGYDFTGWQVYLAGASGATIKNCLFKPGTSGKIPIITDAGSRNTSVLCCKFDAANSGLDCVISHRGTGAATEPGLKMQYCWITAPSADGVQMVSGRHDIRFNLYQNGKYGAGAHADWVQFARSMSDGCVINYNTVYMSDYSGNSRGEGIQVEAQLSSTIRNTEVCNNVVIAAGSQSASYLFAFRDSGDVLDYLKCNDNFIDRSGAYGVFYPATGTHLTYSNNKNMKTGKTVGPDNNES